MTRGQAEAETRRRVSHLTGNAGAQIQTAMGARIGRVWRAPAAGGASWHGHSVSSTYIAIGGIFGVGLYREWYHEQIIREKRDVFALPVGERTRRKLVRRAHQLAILAAWVIAVPATALLPVGLFLLPARIAGAG